MAIDLAKEFDKSELFRNIRMSIEHQQHLYKSWGGSFDNDQINLYLNFFEDVGFYHKYGVLSLEIIDHYYGSYMIEAYENKEIQQYITDLRVNYKQADAFAEFETVTKEIEALPSRGALTALMRRVNKE